MMPPAADEPSADRQPPTPAPTRALLTIAPAILSMVRTATGLESTYIAEVDIDNDEQRILSARNDGALDIAEGRVVTWQDSLCKRAADDGIWSTDNVSRDLPGSSAAEELGINAFVSVPIVGSDDRMLGTLCGASRDSRKVAGDARPVMLVLARLIAEQWDRDRAHEAQRDHLAELERLARDHDVGLAEAEHRLKSPLAIIVGWAETLLGEDHLSDRALLVRGLTGIRDAADRAVTQLDSLLEEARGRSLGAELDVRPTDLSALVDRLADDLAGICRPTHRLVRDITPDLWVTVDREAAFQACWHLAENAVKYSPDGGLITVRLTAGEDDRTVRLSVADEGIGVPAGDDIFTPFVRGSNTGRISGTGLGLHIVRRLVEAMRGSVTVAAVRPRGTEFVVTLPRLRRWTSDRDRAGSGAGD